MDYYYELEKLLDKYIEESKVRFSKYQEMLTLKDLYSELLAKLKKDNYDEIKKNKIGISLLLNMLYSDDKYINDLYRIMLNVNVDEQSRDDFQLLVNHIEADYLNVCSDLNDITNQIYEHKNQVSTANIVKLAFKNQQPLKMNKYDFHNIIKIVEYYKKNGQITAKEAILFINEFKTYNRRLLLANANGKEKKYFETLHDEIPNILNAGFHAYIDPKDDEIDIDDKSKTKIDSYVKTIFDIIKEDSCNDIIGEIKKYYDYYKFDSEEYKYMLVLILDKLFLELHFYYQSLLDLSIYTNSEDRPVAVNNYYKTLDKYLTLFGYYGEFNKSIRLDEITIENVTEDFFGNNDKELIFAHSEIDVTKAKIFKDMRNIPFEYYDRVLRLLTMYKNNTIPYKEIKRIRIKANSNYFELKDDQIRIILKHVKDNIYVVLGLFAKKDDNDPMRYDIIVKRKIPDISTSEKQNVEIELSQKYEEELSQLVEKRARKGNR